MKYTEEDNLDLFPEAKQLAKRQFEAAHYSFKIVQDESPENPLAFQDVFNVACWHQRYTLGHDDETLGRGPRETPADFFTRVAEEVEHGDQLIDLPLYLFDHSGLSISTRLFSCSWDSAQVGHIYIKESEAKKVWPRGVRHQFNTETKSTEYRAFPESRTGYVERIKNLMRSDIETYNYYLTGQVYGFILLDENGDEVDSCYGFYGDDPRKNGISDHIPKHLEHLLPEHC